MIVIKFDWLSERLSKRLTSEDVLWHSWIIKHASNFYQCCAFMCSLCRFNFINIAWKLTEFYYRHVQFPYTHVNDKKNSPPSCNKACLNFDTQCALHSAILIPSFIKFACKLTEFPYNPVFEYHLYLSVKPFTCTLTTNKSNTGRVARVCSDTHSTVGFFTDLKSCQLSEIYSEKKFGIVKNCKSGNSTIVSECEKQLHLRPILLVSSLPATYSLPGCKQTPADLKPAWLTWNRRNRRNLVKSLKSATPNSKKAFQHRKLQRTLPCSYNKKGSECGLAYEIVVARFATAFLHVWHRFFFFS